MRRGVECRPTMIKYHCKNIRELMGHKYNLEMSKNTSLPRFYYVCFNCSFECEGILLINKSSDGLIQKTIKTT